MNHVLDHPVWSALTGPQASLAEGSGPVRRFDPAIALWAAVDPSVDPSVSWPALAALAGPGKDVIVVGTSATPSELTPEWAVGPSIVGYQMVAPELFGDPDPEAVELGPADVPEMQALVERTRPGPFTARTRELGSYLGIRRGGELVAMAGERMRPEGFTEISAVCTDASVRGQGLAGRLVRAVAHGLREARGDVPILHVAGENAGAVRLYRSLGFEVRRDVVFYGLRTAAEVPVSG